MTTPAETTFTNDTNLKEKDDDDIVQYFLDYVSSSLSSSSLSSADDHPDTDVLSNPTANATERLLKEHIDSSSLTFLQGLLVEMRDHQQGQEQIILSQAATEASGAGAGAAAAAATITLSKDGSTTASATDSRNRSTTDDVFFNSKNPVTPLDDATNNGNGDNVVDVSLLYETMKKQSYMMQELYMKVLHMDDKINQIINHQQQQQQQQSLTSIATTTTSTGSTSRTILHRFIPPSTATNATTATATATVSLPPAPIPAAATAPPPRAIRNNNGDIYITRLRRRTRFFFQKIQHIYHLHNVLRTKYHQHYYAQQPGNNNNNNNIDFFMIIKVLVMITIVMSRLQPEQPKASTATKRNMQQNNGDDDNDDNEDTDTIWNHFYMMLQYTIVAVFVSLFILYKTKRLQFIYFFYYKNNIPKRIMSMKYVDDDHDNGIATPAAPVFVTADEIWADHLASNNTQRGQADGDDGIDNHGLQQQPNQRQHRGAELIVGDFFRRQQQLVQWVLLHDWFNGRPIHNDNLNNNNNNNDRNVQQQQLEHAPLMRPLEDDLIFEPNPVVAPTPEQQQVEAEPNIVTRLIRTVLLVMQDIIVFIISFIVSILPIWRNIDPQQFVLLQQQRQRNHPQQEGAANNNNNGVGGGIPIVQPPIDPAEEVDD